MNWVEVSVHTSQGAVEPVSNILHEAGASGVVIQDPNDLVKSWDTTLGKVYELNPDDYPDDGVIVKGYLSEANAHEDAIAQIKNSVTQLEAYGFDIEPNDVTLTDVQEEDWATSWKQYYKPVHVSDQMTIVPTWETYESRDDEVIIELDPGMAFGTGTHPTTLMCLQALERTIQPGTSMIDVGTGSGVLSIAAAKLGAYPIEAYDLDGVAVESARQNIALNGASDSITVAQNNLLDGVEAQADIVVGNLLAEIILAFVDQVPRVLKPGGLFISSGIIEGKKDEVEEALIAAGFTIEETLQMDDWVVIMARNSTD